MSVANFATFLVNKKREIETERARKKCWKKQTEREKVESWHKTESEPLARRHSLNLKLFEHNEDVQIINICSVNRFAGTEERKTLR